MQYRVLAGELIPETQYLERQAEFAKFAEDPSHSLTLGSSTIDHAGLMGFAAGLEGVQDFVPTPIVPGGPLCVQIRHVYTGKYPEDKILTKAKQPMILTSALKDYSMFAPSTRAVNFLTKVKAKTPLTTPSATEAGTPIVAYYPAVTADSLTMTLDFAFDGFDDALVKGIAGAFSALGGLPIFASIGGLLVAGSSLIKLAGDTADRLIDGRPKFTQTVALNFLPSNGPVSTAELRVVCNNSFDHSGYRYDFGVGLVSKANGQPYAGDEPYIVLLIDGAERPNLKKFAPTAATAGQLDKFFGARPGSEVAIGSFVDAMKLLNDFHFRSEADDIKRQLQDTTLTDARKKELNDKLTALVKNILTEELKPPK